MGNFRRTVFPLCGIYTNYRRIFDNMRSYFHAWPRKGDWAMPSRGASPRDEQLQIVVGVIENSLPSIENTRVLAPKEAVANAADLRPLNLQRKSAACLGIADRR
jgi:hypothetical protein